MEDFVLEINGSIRKNETIIIFANCEVTYSGRAESFLSDGDRLIIIKSDGTLLIHQPKGSNPVNYMKENSEHKMIKNEDGLFIKSQNLLLKEYLKIKIKKLYYFKSQEMIDEQQIIIKGTERDMAEMIYKNPELIDKGFKPLSLEEHTKYGFIDVFGYDKNNILVVVECKRYAADPKAVSQLRRYVEKIKKSRGLKKVRGILAAPRITSNGKKMLEDFGFEFRAVNPPKYLEKYNKDQKKIDEY